MKLRPYQQRAIDTAITDVLANEHSLLVLPTASGKSHIIAGIAGGVGSAVVLSPSKEILEQNVAKMRATGFDGIGIYSAGAKSKVVDTVTFATIGSVYKKPELFKDAKCVVVDEVQNINFDKGMYKTFIDDLGVPAVGLSAMPVRMETYTHDDSHDTAVEVRLLNRVKGSIFTKLSHVTQIDVMMQAGYLCPVEYDIRQGYVDIKVSGNGKITDAEARKISRRLQIMERTAKAILELGHSSALVFVTTIDEAVELAQELSDIGINAESVSTKNTPKERAEILSAFKAGKVRVVINVGVLTEGFDYPALEYVILARPTTSVGLYTQMVGRVLRIHEGKTVGRVIDFCGNVDRFGRVETFEFVKSHTGARLRSEVGYLTGYDFIGHKDIEADEYNGLTKSSGMVIPIWMVGKFKGKHISKVPTWYLEGVGERMQWQAMSELASKELRIRRFND
ncbi:MAG: DEAD/DEAH box helicase [Gammaproteobacteria bacterium]|nr:DEAD/DEAH box helicase [Gammaproteobacteria bacterium]